MTVWMHVDPYTSQFLIEVHGSQEDAVKAEYGEIETFVRKALPGEELKFRRGKAVHELKNARPDVYVWDLGGLCAVDYSGNRQLDQSKQLLQQIEDHPNTLFVPWTSMTRSYLRTSLLMLLPEWADENADLPTDPDPLPNVWLPGRESDRKFEDWEESLTAKLKEWAGC